VERTNGLLSTSASLHWRAKNVQTSNNFQQTLLHLAAQAGQEENARLLLQYGAVINAQDQSKRTPLFLAVVQGHRSLVQLLLTSNPQIDLVSIEGETIFHAAAFYGCTSILQDLFLHINGSSGEKRGKLYI
jgi:ankyrin repeat protein